MALFICLYDCFAVYGGVGFGCYAWLIVCVTLLVWFVQVFDFVCLFDLVYFVVLCLL